MEKKYQIGILGAGQLGTFLADVCAKKSEKNELQSWCLFYEKEDDPGALKYRKNASKIQSDIEKRKKQLEECACVILESEFYAYNELKKVETKFLPDIGNYKHFYGKIAQRKFYAELGLNCPKFWIVSDVSDLDNIDSFPVILKRNLLSYDGLGNRECKNPQELHQYAVELGLPLLVEEKLNLKSEFAVGLVAYKDQWIELPLTDTIQKNHICHFVLGPHTLKPKLAETLKSEIDKLKKAKLNGLFAFEFFITHDEKIIINEGAARPHNSQHLAMDLCDISQFDYLIDMALDQTDLKEYKLMAPLGAMINLLGRKNGINPELKISPIPNCYPHTIYMYGKKEGRVGRKLGHLNILDPSNKGQEFTILLEKIYQEYEL